jgi:hypothetical protein
MNLYQWGKVDSTQLLPAFVAGLATSVGLNPLRDITWINHEPGMSLQFFAQGKIDAFMGFAPEPQEMRHKRAVTSPDVTAYLPWGLSLVPTLSSPLSKRSATSRR